MKRFTCSYYHNGAWWVVEITADDWADAEARVNKLGNLRLDGEIMATTRFLWWARLVCWWKNL